METIDKSIWQKKGVRTGLIDQGLERKFNWTDRKVFITGHSGFIGSWLSVLFRYLGAQVFGYSLNQDVHSKSRDIWLRSFGVNSIEGDIRNFRLVMEAMKTSSFDLVVHLAAQPIVRKGYSHPHETLDININGSLNILEACRIQNPTALIHVTSDKCYQNLGQSLQSYKEGDALAGRGPYGWSKAISESLFSVYSELLDLNSIEFRMASVRLGNVLGGGDLSDRLIPNCIRDLENDRDILLRNPNAIRPWQHVLDVINGFTLLAEKMILKQLLAAEVLNFAPPTKHVTSGTLIAGLVREWGGNTSISSATTTPDFPEDTILLLDGAKASALLNWNHKFDTSDLLKSVVEWHRLATKSGSSLQATQVQILNFLSAVNDDDAFL